MLVLGGVLVLSQSWFNGTAGVGNCCKVVAIGDTHPLFTKKTGFWEKGQKIAFLMRGFIHARWCMILLESNSPLVAGMIQFDYTTTCFSSIEVTTYR